MIQQAYKYISLSLALLNVFRPENHLHIENNWVGTGKEGVAMGAEFSVAVGCLL